MKLTFGRLLVGVVLVGLGVGGAFAAGVAVGRRGEETSAVEPSLPASAEQSQQGRLGAALGGRGAALQDRLRQLLQGTPPSGMEGAPGLLGRLGAGGVVERVEGNTITVSGLLGSTTIVVSDKTSVLLPAEAALEDIQEGRRIAVSGERNDDGTVTPSGSWSCPRGPLP